MLEPGRRKQLAASNLFHQIGLEAIEHLLEHCSPRHLAPGETLLEPGAANHNLYLILHGQLRVYLGAKDLPAHAVLGPGDCAGELSLIDGQGASARVIAAEPTELLAVPHDTLWAMVDQSHGIARNLLHILSGRMRHDNLTLVVSQSRSLEFENAASVDALTGIHNRRWMMEAFPRGLRRCEQDLQPLCLLMADIDHFKRINDVHGHLVGDQVLRAIAHQLAEGLRSQDLIARYGGEEFAMLLPNTSTDEGLRIAERLRAQTAIMRIVQTPGGEGESITLSCGVAPLFPGASLENLIGAADEALLRAKDAGRNRVELAHPG
ncbi:MAG: GGDEF domain-containing protein [Rhodocyclaceae bacterium]|nr:GGDEF domain-containing protein [Rhodocyclaceae bacterium]